MADPRESAEGADLHALLDEAINLLSPRQRQVYTLHKYQRLPYREISARLGIGTESVKTHMELAVKTIRRYLRSRMPAASILAVIAVYGNPFA